MKTKITALALVAITALSLAPKPAQANDKTLAVLGGFVGGVLVASELSHNRGYVTAPAVVVNDPCRPVCQPTGYWQESNFRVWVDARWVVDGCDRYGRALRRYVGGHYELRTNRVWVSFNHGGHDRVVAYGYGR